MLKSKVCFFHNKLIIFPSLFFHLLWPLFGWVITYDHMTNVGSMSTVQVTSDLVFWIGLCAVWFHTIQGALQGFFTYMYSINIITSVQMRKGINLVSRYMS